MRNVHRHLTLLVALAAVCAVLYGSASAAASPIGTFTTRGAWSFVSAPSLHPPKLTTDRRTVSRQLTPGFFFVANFPNVAVTQPAKGKPVPMIGQSGPLILDSHLQPVWFNPVPKNVVALDLKLQSFDGKPALSWWQGVINSLGNNNNGTDVVLDQHYRKLAQITGQGGWLLSEHELTIVGHDGWVTSYKPVPMDLTRYHGTANGTLLDSAVQEYDLRTGRLLYTWDALQHISLSQAQSPPLAGPKGPLPWDAYHVNSVQILPGGKFLVSMRNTWGAYLVDIHTGNIVWTLSGNPSFSNFSMPPSARFTWQHDVQLLSGNRVSMFDDACCAVIGPGKFGPASGASRGLVLKLDTSHHSATMVAQYIRPGRFDSGPMGRDAAFLGSTQLLSNGNVLVGWGSRPYFSEFSKSGRLLFDALFPGPDFSYRAFLNKWVGTPFFPPSGAVRTRHGVTTVYASWDGATKVAAWRVLAGPNGKHLRVIVAARAKRGFETAIRMPGRFGSYKVKALDSRGRVLGTSGTFPKHNAPASLPGFY